MKFLPKLYLVGAYGRTYATTQDMVKSWESGDDFRVFPTSTYCSVRDMPTLTRRYSGLCLVNKAGGQHVVFGDFT